MRIAIAIVYTPDWQELADVVLPNIREYAARHGYEVFVRIDPQPYNGFSKFTLLNYLFKVVKVDVVLSMDLDSNITNHNVTIESFLEDEKDFYICQDINTINAGVFITKNTKAAINLIDYVLLWEEHVECEQNGIEKYLHTNRLDDIVKISTGFNDYPLNRYYPSYGKWNYKEGDIVERQKNDWRPGRFIIHTPGLPIETRLSILKDAPIFK